MEYRYDYEGRLATLADASVSMTAQLTVQSVDETTLLVKVGGPSLSIEIIKKRSTTSAKLSAPRKKNVTDWAM